MNCPNCKADLNRHVMEDQGNTAIGELGFVFCLNCLSLCFEGVLERRGKVRKATRSDIEYLSPKEAFELGDAIAWMFKRMAEARMALAELDGI